jgi:hypothetical protein
MLDVKTKNVPYQASKWLSVALLVDADEMKALFESLGPFHIFTVGSVVKRCEGEISKETFLSCYAHYIGQLKTGLLPDDYAYRSLFASIMTTTEEHLYALHVGAEGQLIRIAKPVVQMQSHQLGYSEADGKFRSMVFGTENLLWGLQFSYPQLFEDPQTHAAHKVTESAQFPDTALFRALQKWTRQNTEPTPFIVQDKIVNVPARLGKNCFSWINEHPQLERKGLSVKQHQRT